MCLDVLNALLSFLKQVSVDVQTVTSDCLWSFSHALPHPNNHMNFHLANHSISFPYHGRCGSHICFTSKTEQVLVFHHQNLHNWHMLNQKLSDFDEKTVQPVRRSALHIVFLVHVGLSVRLCDLWFDLAPCSAKIRRDVYLPNHHASLDSTALFSWM